MRTMLGFLLFILSVSILACSSYSVQSDYDPTADFTVLKTYGWITEQEIEGDALARYPLVRKRVHSAVDTVLQGKGYVLQQYGEPDFLVITHAGVKEKIQVSDYGYSYDPWYGPYGYGGRHIDVQHYEEGTLVIDIINTGKKELVWRGMGTGIVHSYAEPEQMERAILEKVTKILEKFPPER